MNKKLYTKKNIYGYILLYFISPLLGLVAALKTKEEKFIVFAGTIFMGFIGSLYFYIPGNDGFTHLRRAVENYDGISFAEFLTSFVPLLTFKGALGQSDIYTHILSYISVSWFAIPELIHVFAGLVLGYFFTKSVLLILKDKSETKLSYLFVVFLIFFLTIRSITALNSIRMWTAMWVLFYGAYAFIYYNKPKYLLLIFISSLIHFSYYLYFPPLLAAFFLRNKPKVAAIVYIASWAFTLPFISISPVLDLIPQDSVFEKRTSYANSIIDDIDDFEESGIQRQRDTNFYKAHGPSIYRNYSTVILSVILLTFIVYKKPGKNLLFLVVAGAMFFSYSNILDVVPAVAGRGHIIGATFMTAAALYLIASYTIHFNRRIEKKLYTFGFVIFIVSAFPFWLFHFSYTINIVSIYIAAFPMVQWLFVDDDMSIRDFIAQFIF